MPDIAFVVPTATQNLVVNPSVELTLNAFAGANGGVIARVSTQQRRGVFSIQVTPGVNAFGGTYYDNVNLTAGQVYTFSVDGLWVSGVDYRIYFATDPVGAVLGTPFTFTGRGIWERFAVTYTETVTTGRRLYVTKNNDASIAVFFLDGFQVENAAFDTTYCDGDQPGCAWIGTEHASFSSRLVTTRKGGRVRRISDFDARAALPYQGFDTPPVKLITQGLPLQDGDILQRTKVLSRTLSFMLVANPDPSDDLFATRLADLVKAKRDIWDMLKPDLVPDGEEPTLMRWLGPTSIVEIPVNYLTGLQGNYNEACVEKAVLKFKAHDPYWLGIGDAGRELATSVTLNLSPAFRRTPDGWDDMDNPAVGALRRIFGFHRLPNQNVVMVGQFLDYDGQANADGIVIWNPVDRTYTPVGIGVGAGDNLQDIAGLANNDFYVCGNVQLIDGVVVSEIAFFDFSTSTFSDPVSGFVSRCQAIAVNLDETFLYAAGGSPTFGLVEAGSRRNLSTGVWTSLDSGVNDNRGFPVVPALFDIAIHPITGDAYYCGSFNEVGTGPIAVSSIAYWDESAGAWANDDLNGGVTATFAAGAVVEEIRAMVFDENGILWAVGSFDRCNGATTPCDGVIFWDGNAWTPVLGLTTPDPFSNIGPQDVTIDKDGNVWVVGNFTEAGDFTNAQGVAFWDGTNWNLPDITLSITPATDIPLKVQFIDEADQNVIYLSIGTVAAYTGDTSVTQTVNNPGTAAAYPTIRIRRAGGTSAQLQSLINETLNETILFEYSLADGEEIVIMLDPNNKSITSTLNGNILHEVLPQSSWSNWRLLPGDNVISAFVQAVGGAVITTTIQWHNRYWTVGGAEQ